MADVKGNMNGPFSEMYDPEDDIYYVTFKTGEPSFCEEVDDVLLVERGIFTKLPTGFRILNFHKNPVRSVRVDVFVKLIRETLEHTERDYPAKIRDREAQLTQALEKVLTH